MSEFNTAKDRESNAKITKPNVGELLTFVTLIILLLIIAHGIFLNLESERTEYLQVEKVANKTYKRYSQKLDAISKRLNFDSMHY